MFGNRRVFWISSSITSVMLVVAVACGSSATPTPTRAPAPTPNPTATTIPEAAATAIPTRAPTATIRATAVPTPTRAPTATPGPLVERLMVGLAPFTHETNLFYQASISSNIASRPILEQLVDVDQVTLQIKPGLATSWDMSPDAKSWTFQLRKGVAFHNGWGEFTAKDVVHSVERLTGEDARATGTRAWRSFVGETTADVLQNVRAVDDYQVTINLKSPSLTLASYDAAGYRDLFMISKAQWDKEGVGGMILKPAGTSSYQYQERETGQYIRYERVPNHWRRTPEFKELQINFIREDATRLATLLAGETHLISLPRSLQNLGTSQGMKLATSKVPITRFTFVIGGNYALTPDKYDATNPLANRLVREAINHAIDRKEIQQSLFSGKGELMYVDGYHANLPGYNPDWEKQFEDKYGYDPAKAKLLLEQAGYPSGFDVTLASFVTSTVPEVPEIVEATNIYLQRVGINSQILATEWAKLRPDVRGRNTDGMIYSNPSSFRAPEQSVRVFNYTKGFLFAFEHPDIDSKLVKFFASFDMPEREQLLREIGDIKFAEYDSIPILWVPAEAMYNPTVIGEYNFGTISGVYTHLDYIKPAQ